MIPHEEFMRAFFEALPELAKWGSDPNFRDRAQWAGEVFSDLLKLKGDWEQIPLPNGPTEIGQLGIKLFDQPEDQKLSNCLSTLADIYNHRWRRQELKLMGQRRGMQPPGKPGPKPKIRSA